MRRYALASSLDLCSYGMSVKPPSYVQRNSWPQNFGGFPLTTPIRINFSFTQDMFFLT